MSEQKLDRRKFFERALMVGAATFGAGAFLSACKSDAKGGGDATKAKKAPAAAAQCTDASLSDAEKGTRKALQYVEKSAQAGKNCGNCKLFQKKDPCNGCTAVPGPIATEGYCTAWVAKA